MKLDKLTWVPDSVPNPEILGITADSRQVRRGWLFAALPGSRANGASFIADAIRNGAAAILAEEGVHLPEDAKSVVLLAVKEPRQDLSRIAAKFYGRQPEKIVAVTGTNGKTSTVDFVRQLWEMAGIKSASIGTLGVKRHKFTCGGSMTTPDPLSLHATLADLAASGVNHLAIEASSHGLDQFRLDGMKLSGAGFTNLTRDHLDYHGTMENYFNAKLRLFSEILEPSGVAVINADVPEYDAVANAAHKRGCKVISFGEKGETIRLTSRRPKPRGQAVTLEIEGKSYTLVVPLVGSFQLMNVLCALGLVLGDGGLDKADDFTGFLESLKGVPGRLELVTEQDFPGAVYIDYAHTPDALENVLKALRPHTAGKLICLIGCGGDRDTGKRSVMGRIASEMADMVIITDDNPRSEDPARIRAAMMQDAIGASEIAGRREAIRFGISNTKAGDVFVIAGKGHEQGQIIGDRVEPFDDMDEAKRAILEMKH